MNYKGASVIHRSNGLTDKLYRTIGQSVSQMNHVLHRKEPSVDPSHKRTMLRVIGPSISQTSNILRDQPIDRPAY